MPIEDFGEYLDGAAKDGWGRYRGALEDAMRRPAGGSLAEAFPEPPYETLIRAEVDPRSVAFVRALRDEIPARPKTGPRALADWTRVVDWVREAATSIISGRLNADEALDGQDDRVVTRIRDKAELYETLGHRHSLKPYRIFGPENDQYRPRSGDQTFAIAKMKKRGGSLVAYGGTRDAAIEALGETLGGPARRQARIQAWQRNDGEIFIGIKKGRQTIKIEEFHGTRSEVNAFIEREHDRLVEAARQLRETPAMRRNGNRERTGPERRQGPADPDTFAETFGFRGVQFGNSVSGVQRQDHLDRAHDALLDLADVLDMPPERVSMDGVLGLAFGARGRGGVQAASAHYEPDRKIINLTNAKGAGSLGHELFHALDSHLLRQAFGSDDGYISTHSNFLHPMRTLMNEIAATGLPKRSGILDRTRSEPYFKTRVEMVARSFEAWLVDALDRKGIRNDYLVNILTEEDFAGRIADRPHLEGSYPYPTEVEMTRISAAFEAFFASPEVRAAIGEQIVREKDVEIDDVADVDTPQMEFDFDNIEFD